MKIKIVKKNQEVKRSLKERAPSIVDERILPELLDNIADWTGEIMGKLTHLAPQVGPKETDQTFNQIYEGLVKETMKQLEKSVEIKRKKLTK